MHCLQKRHFTNSGFFMSRVWTGYKFKSEDTTWDNQASMEG
jgi:hypothetical protein